MKLQGTLFIVSAPSGAGKSSLIHEVIRQAPETRQLSVSHTSRPKRATEIAGRDYHFVSVDEFKDSIENNAFLESAKVFGNYYGTSKQDIESRLSAGMDVFLDIDWQGARQIMASTQYQVVSIYIFPPSRQALEKRLRDRDLDSDTVITQRMHAAISELSHYHEYEYLIVNDDFQAAAKELDAIIRSYRLKRASQAVIHRKLIKNLLEIS